jgi:small-conductance mechanosensitive channel
LADFLDNLSLSDIAERAGDLGLSRLFVEHLVVQTALIALVYLAASGLRRLARPWVERLGDRLRTQRPTAETRDGLWQLAIFCIAWLMLLITERAGRHLGIDVTLIGVAASLTGLWVVLRGSSLLLQDALLARAVATTAWIVVALDILGLLGPISAALDSLAITLGTARLSLLVGLKAAVVIAVLLWVALALHRLIGNRLQQVTGLSPSVQVLSGNLLKILLITLALLIGLNAVGLDLTAFTVLSGAIGVGIGLGLQKIVANFISGIVLLVERSIKPGDVIEVGNTFGWITSLSARYVSVRGRDGKSYLIPNESLITNQVINWSYSNPLIRLDAPFGVAYDSDLSQVREVAITAAQEVKRVMAAPAPVCHVTGFGESTINLVLRFWIEDPANGVTNIKGDVFFALWLAFREHHIDLPAPQQDIRIREWSAELPLMTARSDGRSSAAAK